MFGLPAVGIGINAFAGDINAFWGDISPFGGDINAFADYQGVGEFWRGMGAFWQDLDADWGALGPLSLNLAQYTALQADLNEIETPKGAAKWRGRRPVVTLVTTTYARGVKLTEAAMVEVEAQLRRLPGLEKYFVDIVPALDGGPG